MVDIVDVDPDDSLPCMWPPSRVYRLRAAIAHIESHPDLQQDNWLGEAEKKLRVALDRCNLYWGITDSSHVRYK